MEQNIVSLRFCFNSKAKCFLISCVENLYVVCEPNEKFAQLVEFLQKHKEVIIIFQSEAFL